MNVAPNEIQWLPMNWFNGCLFQSSKTAVSILEPERGPCINGPGLGPISCPVCSVPGRCWRSFRKIQTSGWVTSLCELAFAAGGKN